MRDKTINELRAEAVKKGIRLLSSMKKQDIRKALEKARRSRKASRSKAALPVAKKKDLSRPPMKTAMKGKASSPLPEEYGENDFFLIAVDPDVVYASWEISRKDLPVQRRGLRIRLFDLTGTGPDGRPERFIDIAIQKRVGSGFFEIKMHGRDVVAEVGHMKNGRFRPVLRSNMVSFPVPMHYYDSGAQEPPEPGTPVGY